jgi:hypothetical protein
MNTTHNRRDASPGGRGGRPDERFPRLETERIGEGRDATLVSVVAQVNLSREEGKIEFVNPLTSGQPSPALRESDVVLKVKDGKGAVLVDAPVVVKLDSEAAEHEERRGLVDVVLSIPSGARTIDLLIDGQVVDTFKAASPPPDARTVRPTRIEGEELHLAIDHETDMSAGHTYAVQVSTDDGRTWHTVAIGAKRPEVAMDRGQLAGASAVRFRVLTTNGFVASVATSEPFEISKLPPVRRA